MTAGTTPATAAPRRPDRGIVLGGVLGGLASTAGIALTATSGWLVVTAAQRPVILTLLVAIVAVRAFGILRPVLRYWERLVSHDAALATLAARRTEVYRALIPLTPARLGRRRRADVLTGVVDDLTDEVEAQVRVTVPVIGTVVAGLLTVAVTAALAPAVGLVLVGLGVVVAVVTRAGLVLEQRRLPELLAARAEAARVAEAVTTRAGDLAAIRAGGRAREWLTTADAALLAVTRRLARGRAATGAVLLVAVAAAVAATALVLPDGHSPAVRALLLLTPVAAADLVPPLAEAVQALARSRGSRARVTALVAQEPAVRASPDHRPGATVARPTVPTEPTVPTVAAEGLTASWTGERTDLGPVDLTMTPGSSIAVTGPNGAGKSTLLAVLARQLDPADGRVTWDGTDTRGLPVGEVRDRVAVVDDDPHVFATDLRGNLRLAAPTASDADLVAALHRAGLARFLADLPDGLGTRLGTDGRGISGGELARLGVARALVSRRPVLLLDEPVAHLDHATATAVLTDLLSRRGTGAGRPTVVLVSHRDEGLDLVDRVVDLPTPRR